MEMLSMPDHTHKSHIFRLLLKSSHDFVGTRNLHIYLHYYLLKMLKQGFKITFLASIYNILMTKTRHYCIEWLMMETSLWVFVILQLCLVMVKGQQVPAMFIFGDSLVDVGNNNYLSSIAKANYYPYGCDTTVGPTGRFTNARTSVDIIGDLLGIRPYPPAFIDPSATGPRILRGVNYASAAGGILDETGQNYGDRYALNQQVLNFETITLNQLRSMMGARNLSQYLSKSIAMMVFGSNDYINNYFLPSYPSSSNYTPKQYAELLLNRYARQILALHSVGLRKFFLAGVGPLGCIPYRRAAAPAPPGRCVDRENQMVGPFNQGLLSLVNQLNNNHPGAVFVYGNTYGAVGDMLNNPSRYGFRVIDTGCCGINSVSQITCLPFSVPCQNRNQFLFWDAFHPTQAAAIVLARRAFSGPPSDCYPINIRQMAAI